jgi:cell division protein FtsQ
MKMGSRRGAGGGSAVLDLSEGSFAAPTDGRGRVPAPAGALQRGAGAGEFYGGPVDGAVWGAEPEERPYVPRRGSFRFGLRALPRSVGGRIVLGMVAVGMLMVVAGAAVTVRYYLLHDPRFVVTTSSEIQISGNEHLTRAQVLSVFGADLERNIFKVPLAERKADLERLPWVEHATVMRLLPDHLRIAIVERVPVAFVRQGTQIGLVDASGVLLDMPEQVAGDPAYSFPVLTGLSAGDPQSVRAARMEIYRKFTSDLDSGASSSGARPTQSLSEVDVSNPEDVKALVTSGGSEVLVHFGDEDFLARYKSFEEHLPQWLQQYPKLASADMRYDGQIVLEMQKGAEVPIEGQSAESAAAVDPGHPAVAVAAKPAVTHAKVGAQSAAAKTPARKSNVVKTAAAKPVVAKPAAKMSSAQVAAALAAARKPAGVQQ